MVVAVKQVEFEDRLKEFRAERIGMILAGEVPVRMEEGGRAVLHIVPQGAFESVISLDLHAIKEGGDTPWPIDSGGYGTTRYNFDGLLSFSTEGDVAYSYVQLFHNGVVEAVNSSLLKNHSDKPIIGGRHFEEEVRRITKSSLPLLKHNGVEVPLYIMLSFLRVKGYRMAVNQIVYHERYPIDRDGLLVPAGVLESFESDVDQLLLPAFNRIWNASGVARSPNYDENGTWKER